MKKNLFKILFFIALVLLILTNIFWLYSSIDVAVGHEYYKVSCEEWHKDAIILEELLSDNYNYDNMINYLKGKRVVYTEFKKGDFFVVQLNSFTLIYDKNGELIEEKSF